MERRRRRWGIKERRNYLVNIREILFGRASCFPCIGHDFGLTLINLCSTRRRGECARAVDFQAWLWAAPRKRLANFAMCNKREQKINEWNSFLRLKIHFPWVRRRYKFFATSFADNCCRLERKLRCYNNHFLQNWCGRAKSYIAMRLNQFTSIRVSS